MPLLADVLSQDPHLQWQVGRVEVIHYDRGTIDVVIGDVGDPSEDVARIVDVGFMDSYRPKIYDVVHILSHPRQGAIVIGMGKASGDQQVGGGGTTWFVGTGAPEDPYPGAVPGDFYLDNDNGDVWWLQ
jgi:hypothetical protein